MYAWLKPKSGHQSLKASKSGAVVESMAQKQTVTYMKSSRYNLEPSIAAVKLTSADPRPGDLYAKGEVVQLEKSYLY